MTEKEGGRVNGDRIKEKINQKSEILVHKKKWRERKGAKTVKIVVYSVCVMYKYM